MNKICRRCLMTLLVGHQYYDQIPGLPPSIAYCTFCYKQTKLNGGILMQVPCPLGQHRCSGCLLPTQKCTCPPTANICCLICGSTPMQISNAQPPSGPMYITPNVHPPLTYAAIVAKVQSSAPKCRQCGMDWCAYLDQSYSSRHAGLCVRCQRKAA